MHKCPHYAGMKTGPWNENVDTLELAVREFEVNHQEHRIMWGKREKVTKNPNELNQVKETVI